LLKKVPFSRFLATFLYLIIFWLFLSGHYDIFHISIGILCCAGVSYASTELLFRYQPDKKRTFIIMEFLIYSLWLLCQIVIANLQVARLVLSPKLKIDPRIVVYKCRYLKGDVPKATYGNSITLTPGTITLDIHGPDFYVHALTPTFAKVLKNGSMERKVAHIYH
jgi:multicomponent Na+:H+ antiporter subunit E